MTESDIFEPFDRLVEIEICGARRAVPANNTLLRCFQYLSMDAISASDLCWNGDCADCQVWLASHGQEKPFLACRTTVREQMKIVRLSEKISLESEVSSAEPD